MKTASALALLGAALPALATPALPLSTSSRWILDSNGDRVKLTCANWAGHLEANTPEGLNKQPVATIAEFIASQGFNCVRLTYSIDYALNPTLSMEDSFTQVAPSNTPVNASTWTGIYNDIVSVNPWAATATLQDAYSEVISSLWANGVMTILDNHVSKASWCCNLTDGNGWWDTAYGYNSANSRYFNTTNWYQGLDDIATWAATQDGVIAMSLRNELRAFLLQSTGAGSDDWYNILTTAATGVHSKNSDLLIIIGGANSAEDLSYLKTQGTLDFSAWSGKHVWEWHNYAFSVQFDLFQGDCSALQDAWGYYDGFVLTQGEDYTAPLILSEFGFGMTGGPNSGLTDGDYSYFTCLKEYLGDNDSEWIIWAIQGSYYVREGQVDYDEGYGVLDHNWDGLRNTALPTLLGSLFNATQGP
ncbi:glycoside hydrolase family 5 protein [Xylariaceae sp. FL0255]|nr:glycoside hydrolase family 5 protein [Xylariaceae sp. FL0255]